MHKISTIRYKSFERISPSQFSALKKCTYKGILAKAFDNKPLLPLSPNAYLGTVLHKVLELISRGRINNEYQLSERFSKELAELEQKLISDGLQQFVPLQMNVADFGLKKVQLKRHLVSQNKASRGTNYLTEKWIESRDKKIGGCVDLIIETDHFTEIIDFKTGAITEGVLDDTGEIFKELKLEYREQLKIYAYLYYEHTNKFPDVLSIVDLGKNKFNLDFNFEKCEALFHQAKELLERINKSIQTGRFDSNPNDQNCKFCLYRPACTSYMDKLGVDYSLGDISGKIRRVKQYQNGNVSIVVENSRGETVTVTGFSSIHHHYFKNRTDQNISAFNLKKEATDMVYSVTRTTKLYE